MESAGYVDFYEIAKLYEVKRDRINRWCRRGLKLARKPTEEELALIVLRDGRVYLKRRNFGRKDVRTRWEWLDAFLAVVTPE